MLISRSIAKGRIARGERPSFFGAWGLVLADAVAFALVVVLLWSPFASVTESLNFPTWATAAAMFALGFIPMQAVLIISALWAAKSRWEDVET